MPLVPLNLVVPVPAVCETFPVVRSVPENVRSCAEATVIELSTDVAPTAPATETSAVPAVRLSERGVASLLMVLVNVTLPSVVEATVSMATLFFSTTAPVKVTTPATFVVVLPSVRSVVPSRLIVVAVSDSPPSRVVTFCTSTLEALATVSDCTA